MSARAERIFSADLRQVERGLSLPVLRRIRILRELESDLEALAGRLMADGLLPAEARERALDALMPDRATLAALERLHAPWYRRATAHMTPERLRFAERGALALATAVVVLAGAAALLRADLLESPSPFLFPVLGLGAVLFGAVAWAAFRLWVKGDHAPLDGSVSWILAASAATLAVGFVGAFIDVYRLAETLTESPELASTLTQEWLVREAALLSVALLVALAGGVAWFALSQWVALVQGERRELLGLPRHPKRTRRSRC